MLKLRRRIGSIVPSISRIDHLPYETTLTVVRQFYVFNGVRQGGMLSHVLFAVFIAIKVIGDLTRIGLDYQVTRISITKIFSVLFG